MVDIKKFVFSPFQENTYVLVSECKDCWIIDPGCYHKEEKQVLERFIAENKLNPTRLINTHCHLDHVFGNKFVYDAFDLLPEYHQRDEQTMKYASVSADMYGIPGFEESPKAKAYLKEGTVLKLGDHEFEIVFVPGHAPGHIALINHKDKFVIGGDVLFQGSIGRTDLPGGSFDTLVKSIKSQFYILADDYVVHSGHGPETSIGFEKRTNPFIKN